MSLAKAGPFELIELLGEGGVGQVYSARDPVLGRRVAIKMLRRELSDDREFRDRFYGEAQRLGDLNHANITTLYGLHFDDDKPFMVMELVRGRTLKEVREAAGRLPPRESLAVLAQTLAGLAYAHRAGVIHRDIKPSNLMITDGGIVKIMDFGIARVRGSQHMTRAGQALLTPLYASPEQIKGEEVDERSDLYSLGVVFYEMLAGRPPFTAKSEYLLERAHLEEPPPLLAQGPDLDPAIEAAALRALAKNPEDRFASAEEFGRAVGARAIRGDAPDILQEFLAAVFRATAPDETRRIGLASGALAPLIPQTGNKNPPAASPLSWPSPIEKREAPAGDLSPAMEEPAGEPLRQALGDEPQTALPEESLRRDRDKGTAAYTPADEFALKGAGISPPPEPPAVGTIRVETRPAAPPPSRPRSAVPIPAAILGGIALALGLGYGGLQFWGPLSSGRLSGPGPVAAVEPSPRLSGSSLRPSAVLPEAHHSAPETPLKTEPPSTGKPSAPLRTAPVLPRAAAPPAGKTPPAAPRIASRPPPKTEPPVRTAGPAPPAGKTPPAAPRIASRPPPKTEPPAATAKPAAPLRTASIAPPRDALPKTPSALGPPPLPHPQPDLEGTVMGAMNAGTIKVGGRWIELYGITDPTRNVRRHIETLKKYLTPARGRVACYRKTAEKYQCYSGGQDLALLALRDGIARPAHDAPAEYREAARRSESYQKQP